MYRFLVIGILLVAAKSHGAVISNEITETPRIQDGEELISVIIRDCISYDGMSCLKGKVLTYLDSVLGLNVEDSRSYQEKNVDKAIYDRVSRVLSTNEIRVELPKVLFGDVIASYQANRGLDFLVPQKSEARGILKKKLLFPVLLLLKLKMKALMPIFVALIGLKAMKALILSKLAITIVLGFMIAQLVKKTGLGMPMMSMMPAMPATEPMNTYGPPSTPATPDTSYGPAAWEPASASSSYSLRNWEPSVASSSQNLAYSSYYPNSASYSSSPSSSSNSASSASSSSPAQAQAY